MLSHRYFPDADLYDFVDGEVRYLYGGEAKVVIGGMVDDDFGVGLRLDGIWRFVSGDFGHDGRAISVVGVFHRKGGAFCVRRECWCDDAPERPFQEETAVVVSLCMLYDVVNPLVGFPWGQEGACLDFVTRVLCGIAGASSYADDDSWVIGERDGIWPRRIAETLFDACDDVLFVEHCLSYDGRRILSLLDSGYVLVVESYAKQYVSVLGCALDNAHVGILARTDAGIVFVDVDGANFATDDQVVVLGESVVPDDVLVKHQWHGFFVVGVHVGGGLS